MKLFAHSRIILPIFLVLLVSVAISLPGDACDGTPPKLINQDATTHEYQLISGKEIERWSIQSGETKELRGKSGFQLKLGDAKSTKLSNDMVCTISEAQLSCTLL